MNNVVAPLSPGDSGPRVADLQAALTVLVERHVLEVPDAEWSDLERRLRMETNREVFGRATEYLVVRFRLASGLGEAAAVDSDTAAALNDALASLGLLVPAADDRRLVRGRVVGAGAGHSVHVYDKDMRSEEPLEETTTKSDGTYEITYTRAQFARAEKEAADLRVALLNDAGREIASTPVIFNAGPVETAPDIVLPDDRSED